MFALVPCAGVGRARRHRWAQAVRPGRRPRAGGAHAARVGRGCSACTPCWWCCADDDTAFERQCPTSPVSAAGARGAVARRARARWPTACTCWRERGAADDDWVLVHDAARCLVRAGMGRAPDRRLPRRRGGRPAGAAGGRHAEGRARRARRPRTVDRARQVGGADAADVSPRRAARRAGACRRCGDRRGRRHRGARACAAAGAGRRSQPQGHLAGGLRAGRRRCCVARDGATIRTAGAQQLRIGEGWDMHALVAGPPAGAGRRRRSRTATACSATPTPTRCCTRSPTRCSAPRRWATSAATFRTPTRRSRAPTRSRCWPRRRGACARRATRSATSTAPSSRRRRSWRRTSRRCASASPLRSASGRRPGQRQGQDGREDGAGGRGPRDRGARGLPAAACRRRR